MLKEIKQFFNRRIWRIDITQISPIRRFFIQQLRIIILSIRGFVNDKCQIRASAMTFYSLLSFVPVIAVAFALAKGFGYEQVLQAQILSSATDENQVFVLKYVFEFANKMLDTTQGGLLASLSLVVLLWSVMQLLGNIEGSFNDIWRENKSRSFLRKLTDYFSIMLVTPILLILSSSMTVFLKSKVTDISEQASYLSFLDSIADILGDFAPYIVIWFVFVTIYLIMPNAKVKFKSALIAGVIAGTLFQIFQWIYIDFQVGVAKYNAIYGSFAALPLFLIWLQISWNIVLLGAEISFAYQNVRHFEFEHESNELSHNLRKKIGIYILHYIIQKFKQSDVPVTFTEISSTLKVPFRMCLEIISELQSVHLINEVVYENEDAYQPSTDIAKYSFSMVVEKLDNRGLDEIETIQSETFKLIDHNFNKLEEEFKKSTYDKSLKEL